MMALCFDEAATGRFLPRVFSRLAADSEPGDRRVAMVDPSAGEWREFIANEAGDLDE
jgi:hypothetical protein